MVSLEHKVMKPLSSSRFPKKKVVKAQGPAVEDCKHSKHV